MWLFWLLVGIGVGWFFPVPAWFPGFIDWIKSKFKR